MRAVKVLLVLPILFVGSLILLTSLNYYQPDFSRGYLLGKESFFYGIFQYGLYAHIIATPLVLLIGTAQIFFRYEFRWRGLHRWLGRIYAGLILMMAAPGALIMAPHALGGSWGKANFWVLGVLWIVTTALAWRTARQRRFTAHRHWMNWSYLLAVSAINLRILYFCFVYFLEWRTPETYAWAAWLSWLPFVVVYELWWQLRKRKTKKLSSPAS